MRDLKAEARSMIEDCLAGAPGFHWTARHDLLTIVIKSSLEKAHDAGVEEERTRPISRIVEFSPTLPPEAGEFLRPEIPLNHYRFNGHLRKGPFPSGIFELKKGDLLEFTNGVTYTAPCTGRYALEHIMGQGREIL